MIGSRPINTSARCFVWTLVFCVKLSVPAAQLVVDKDNGPYVTIDSALRAAEAGDSVLVKNGMYRESELRVKSDVSLVGESPEGVLIGRSDSHFTGATVLLDARSRLSAVTLQNSGGDGVYIGTDPNAQVQRCIIRSNKFDGIVLHPRTAVNAGISSCLIYGNGDYGINAGGNGVNVFNCTIYGNGKAGIYNPWQPNESLFNRINVRNSIIWNHPTTNSIEKRGFTTTISVEHSCIQGGYTGTNVLNIDPGFVAHGSEDFRLRPVSPCVDSGFGGGQTATDLDGTPRRLGSVDMGAYEFPAIHLTTNRVVSNEDGGAVAKLAFAKLRGANGGRIATNSLLSVTDPSLFYMLPILDAAGNLIYMPAKDTFGTTEVAVISSYVTTVKTITNRFTIEIQSVNDPPFLSMNSNSLIEQTMVGPTNSGALVAWGHNDKGQLGWWENFHSHMPVQVRGLSNVISFSAGIGHGLAVTADGTCWSWGENYDGQLGDGTRIDRSLPAPVEGLSNIVQVAAGNDHSMALDMAGQIWAWGNNYNGAVGDGSRLDRHTPTRVLDISNVIGISADNHSMALTADGFVWAWGDNVWGQLGTGDETDRPRPTKVVGLPLISSIAAEQAGSEALDENGVLWRWGISVWGDEIRSGNLPMQRDDLPPMTDFAVGNYHATILTHGGEVHVWGQTDAGLSTLGLPTVVGEPTQLPFLTNVGSLEVGWFYSLALSRSGWIWAGGENGSSSLGLPVAIDSHAHGIVMGITNAVSVSAGGGFSLALSRDGRLLAWGRNDRGQLGNGASLRTTEPTPVKLQRDFVAVDCGAFHSVGVATDGSVWTWGENRGGLSFGAARDGRVDEFVRLGQLADITDISVGGDHALALDRSGMVWAWGWFRQNLVGTAGNDGYVPKPVSLPECSIVAASGWGPSSLAVDTTGRCWTWGRNHSGQLGDGTTTDRGVPALVAGVSNIVAATFGRDFVVVCDDRGQVWSWGGNQNGTLGIGNTTNSRIPVRVEGLSNIVAVSADMDHVLALDIHGGVWAWGDAWDDQLGLGSRVDRHIPTKVAGLPPIERVKAVWFNRSYAIDNNGRLWGWGNTRVLNPFTGSTPYSLLHHEVIGTNRPVLLSEVDAVVDIDGGLDHTIAIVRSPVRALLSKGKGGQKLPGVISSIGPGPENESSENLRFMVTADDPRLFASGPTADALGNISFVPASNGVSRIRVSAVDSGGLANAEEQSFVLAVDLQESEARFSVAEVGGGRIEVNPAPGGFSLGESVVLNASNGDAHTFSHWVSNGVSVFGTDSLSASVGPTNSVVGVFTNRWPTEWRHRRVFDRTFGYEYYDGSSCITLTSDGGFIVGGYMERPPVIPTNYWGFGEVDIFIRKFDRAGLLEWERHLGYDDDDFPHKIIQLEDGGFLVAATRTFPSEKSDEVWLFKLDSTGEMEWEKTFGGNSLDVVTDMLRSKDGSIYLATWSLSGVSNDKTVGSYGGQDGWMLKLDSTGDILWQQSYGGTNNEYITSLNWDGEKHMLVGLTSNSPTNTFKQVESFGGDDYWALRLGTNGIVDWQRSFGGLGLDRLVTVLRTADGGILFCGNSQSGRDGNKQTELIGGFDVWVIKLDAFGNEEWQRSFGGAGDDTVAKVIPSDDGGYWFLGTTDSPVSGTLSKTPIGSNDVWIVRIDAFGEQLAEHRVGGTGDDGLSDAFLRSDGVLVFAGGSDSGADGNKHSPSIALSDQWVFAIGMAELPVSAAHVLIDGRPSYIGTVSVTNSAEISFTNVQPEGLFFTLDGSDPLSPDSGRLHVSSGSLFSRTVRSNVIVRAASIVGGELIPNEPVTIDVRPGYRFTSGTLGGGTVDPSSGQVLSNQSVTIAATPANGNWAVIGWTNLGAVTNQTIQLSIREDTHVEVVFGAELKTSVFGNGRILVLSTNERHSFGVSVSMVAIPDDGHELETWSIPSTNGNPARFGFNDVNRTATTAFFKPLQPDHYALTAYATNGGTAALGSYATSYRSGSSVTASARAENGFIFSHWTANGTRIEGGPDQAISMESNVVLEAHFQKLDFARPEIRVQPIGGVAFVGESHELRVEAEGIGPLTYQWEFAGADISGANEPVLHLGPVTIQNEGGYRVRVTNPAGTTFSATAELRVMELNRIGRMHGGVDGVVNDLAKVGDELFVGGAFNNYVQFAGTAGIMRTNGSVRQDWIPFAGQVTASEADGSGGYYLAVETATDTEIIFQIVHVLADGSLDDRFNALASGPINRLSLVSDKLIVAGGFDSLAGINQPLLGAVDSVTGDFVEWRPTVSGEEVKAVVVDFASDAVFVGGQFQGTPGIHGQNLAKFGLVDGSGIRFVAEPADGKVIETMALHGNTLYVAGGFNFIGSKPREKLAALDTRTAEVLPQRFSIGSGEIYSLLVHNDVLYLGGDFNLVGIYPQYAPERDGLAAIDLAALSLLGWNPGIGPVDVVRTLATDGENIYLAGLLTSVAGLVRNGAAAVAIDQAGTSVGSWNPNVAGLNGVGEVLTLTVQGDEVLVGGRFDLFGRVPRSNLLAFDLQTGALASWNPNPNKPVEVATEDRGRLMVGGQFTSISGTSRSYLAEYRLGASDPTILPDGGIADDFVEAIAVSDDLTFVAGRGAVSAIEWSSGAKFFEFNVVGDVRALCRVGHLLFVGGDFIELGGMPSTNLAVIRLGSREVVAGVPIPNAGVQTIVSDGETVFFGGLFDQVAGRDAGGSVLSAPRSKLAALNVRTLRLSSWAPELVGKVVNDLEFANGRIYAVGDFLLVGGAKHAGFVMLDEAGNPAGSEGIELFGGPDPLANAVHVDAGSAWIGGRFGFAERGGIYEPVANVAVVGPQGAPVQVPGQVEFTVTSGDLLELKPEIYGAGPISYQWYRDGTFLEGEQGLTLKVATETPTSARYFVVASNVLGVISNLVATVVVSPPPDINQVVQNHAIPIGGSVTIPSGAVPGLTVYWYRNGVRFWEGPDLTLSNARVQDSGTYSYRTKNAAGKVRDSGPISVVVGSASDVLADAFSGRLAINGATGIRHGSNSNATAELLEPRIHQTHRSRHTVWFGWLAPNSGQVRFSTLGSATTTEMGVYEVTSGGNSFGNLRAIGSGRNRAEFGSSELLFDAVTGREYAIVVDSVRGNEPGNIVLSWELTGRPDLTPIVVEVSDNQTVVDGQSVTFSVQLATDDSNVEIQWFHLNHAIVGATGPTLTVADVSPAELGQYRVRAKIGGTEVWARAGSVELGPDTGIRTADNLDELLEQSGLAPASPGTPPATSLTPGFSVVSGKVYTQIFRLDEASTVDTGEPVVGGSGIGNTRWLTFTCPEAGTVVIDTIGSEANAVIAVYTGSHASNLQLVQSDRNGATDGRAAELQFNCVPGRTYAIAIDREDSAVGYVRLNIRMGQGPVFLRHLASVQAPEDGKIRLSVEVIGDPPPSLQWWRDGQRIPGATNSVFEIDRADLGHAGMYQVTAQNAVDFTSTRSASLTLGGWLLNPRFSFPETGGMSIEVDSPAGVEVVVEASRDFNTWEVVKTATSAGGVQKYLLELTTSAPSCFVRVYYRF